MRALILGCYEWRKTSRHTLYLSSRLFFPSSYFPIPLFSQSLGWQKAREVGGGENGKESANRKAGFHRKSKKCSWVHEAHEGGKPDLLYFPRNHVICSSLTYGHRYSNRRSRFLLFSFSVTSIHFFFRYICLSVLSGPAVCVTEYLRQVWQCRIYYKFSCWRTSFIEDRLSDVWMYSNCS